MKRLVLFCLISLFIISLRTAGFDPVFAEPPKIVKFATLAPQGSVWLNVVDDIADEIRKKSEGKLRFKIYAGGIAGKKTSEIVEGKLFSPTLLADIKKGIEALRD